MGCRGGTIEIYPTSGQNRDNENKESSPDSCNNTDWDRRGTSVQAT
jgi:hypothetical protein